MNYRSNPSNINNYSVWSQLPEQLSIEDQFALLSSLPNYHKWLWGVPVKVLRFEQKLSTSCRYYPGSPRNRIIQACCFRNESLEIVRACLFNVLGEKVKVTYPVKRVAATEYHGRHVIKKKKKALAEVLGMKQCEVTFFGKCTPKFLFC